MSYFKIEKSNIRVLLKGLAALNEKQLYSNIMEDVYDIHPHYFETQNFCVETWLLKRFVSDPQWLHTIMHPRNALSFLKDISETINERGYVPMINPDKFICWNENVCDMLLMRVVIRATERFIESQINLEWFKRESEAICKSCNCDNGFSFVKGFGDYYKDNYSMNY